MTTLWLTFLCRSLWHKMYPRACLKKESNQLQSSKEIPGLRYFSLGSGWIRRKAKEHELSCYGKVLRGFWMDEVIITYISQVLSKTLCCLYRPWLWQNTILSIFKWSFFLSFPPLLARPPDARDTLASYSQSYVTGKSEHWLECVGFSHKIEKESSKHWKNLTQNYCLSTLGICWREKGMGW